MRGGASPRTQDERRDATRALLVKTARVRFARDGYDAPIESVLTDAGVSKGALYHHFSSKQELFTAVFEEVSRETIAAAAGQAPKRAAPSERLKASLFAWLKASEKPETAEILYDLAPKALGWADAREIEERYSMGLMRASVTACLERGHAQGRNPDLIVRLINATLAEIAMARRSTGGRSPNDAESKAVINTIVDALLPRR